MKNSKICCVFLMGALLVLSGCPFFGNNPTRLVVNNASDLEVSVIIFQDLLMLPELIVPVGDGLTITGYFENTVPVGGGRIMFGNFRVIVSNAQTMEFIADCEVTISPRDELTIDISSGGEVPTVSCTVVDR